jgi:hypothetical protein
MKFHQSCVHRDEKILKLLRNALKMSLKTKKKALKCPLKKERSESKKLFKI